MGKRAAAHLKASVQSLTSHDGGIHAGEEIGHRVVPGHEQKINGAVETGNVPVQADAETKDNVPHGCGCRSELDDQSIKKYRGGEPRTSPPQRECADNRLSLSRHPLLRFDASNRNAMPAGSHLRYHKIDSSTREK